MGTRRFAFGVCVVLLAVLALAPQVEASLTVVADDEGRRIFVDVQGADAGQPVVIQPLGGGSALAATTVSHTANRTVVRADGVSSGVYDVRAGGSAGIVEVGGVALASDLAALDEAFRVYAEGSWARLGVILAELESLERSLANVSASLAALGAGSQATNASVAALASDVAAQQATLRSVKDEVASLEFPQDVATTSDVDDVAESVAVVGAAQARTPWYVPVLLVLSAVVAGAVAGPPLARRVASWRDARPKSSPGTTDPPTAVVPGGAERVAEPEAVDDAPEYAGGNAFSSAMRSVLLRRPPEPMADLRVDSIEAELAPTPPAVASANGSGHATPVDHEVPSPGVPDGLAPQSSSPPPGGHAPEVADGTPGSSNVEPPEPIIEAEAERDARLAREEEERLWAAAHNGEAFVQTANGGGGRT